MLVDPLLMSLAAVAILLGLPLAAIAGVALRIRVKERARDAYLALVDAELRSAGAEPLGGGHYRWEGSVFRVEAGTNPLFASAFSVRLAAYSPTVHEFELRRGAPVAPGLEKFAALLERWDAAGKMHLECYLAGVRTARGLAGDLRALGQLAAQPLSAPCRGGTWTIREGFERDVPQWHWRHDQRPRLPAGAARFCVSYWQGDPCLNPGLLRLFEELAGPARLYYVTDAPDLKFLEHAFGAGAALRRGALVEVKPPEAAIAADRYLDGGFFDGLLAADRPPAGLEDAPRFRFHDRAVAALADARFYARRLFDEEFSWYSGEYEIVSPAPIDVRGAVGRVAAAFGARVLEIDRRFNKRIVVPLEH